MTQHLIRLTPEQVGLVERWRAVCSCGWRGETSDIAQREGKNHRENAERAERERGE